MQTRPAVGPAYVNRYVAPLPLFRGCIPLNQYLGTCSQTGKNQRHQWCRKHIARGFIGTKGRACRRQSSVDASSTMNLARAFAILEGMNAPDGTLAPARFVQGAIPLVEGPLPVRKDTVPRRNRSAGRRQEIPARVTVLRSCRQPCRLPRPEVAKQTDANRQLAGFLSVDAGAGLAGRVAQAPGCAAALGHISRPERQAKT